MRRSAMAEKNSMAGEMVFQFDKPHRVGTVCRFPCSQCCDDDIATLVLTDANNSNLPPTPLYILAEATVSDWQQSVRVNGGGEDVPISEYFYFVRAD